MEVHTANTVERKRVEFVQQMRESSWLRARKMAGLYDTESSPSANALLAF